MILALLHKAVSPYTHPEQRPVKGKRGIYMQTKHLGKKPEQQQLSHVVSVWHGAREKDIHTSRQDLAAFYGPAYYFTNNKKVATVYAHGWGEVERYKLSLSKVFDPDVMLLDPVILDKHGVSYNKQKRSAFVKDMIEELEWDTESKHSPDPYTGANSPERLKQLKEEAAKGWVPAGAITGWGQQGRADNKHGIPAAMKEHGYDGMAIYNLHGLGDVEQREWVVWDLSKVKLSKAVSSYTHPEQHAVKGKTGIYMQTKHVGRAPVESLSGYRVVKQHVSPGRAGMEELGGVTEIVLKDGTTAALKFGDNPKQLMAEYVSNAVYNVMGIHARQAKLVNVEGKQALLMDWLEGYTSFPELSSEQQAKARKQLQQGFVTDALLANWDVLGFGNDNIFYNEETDDAVRIDNGGSLYYSGTGGVREGKFGDRVVELRTMTDPARKSGRVFSGISKEEIQKQVKEIVAKKDAILAAVPDEQIRSVLARRIDSLTHTDMQKAKRILHPERKNVKGKHPHQQVYHIANAELPKPRDPQSALNDILDDPKMRTALAYLRGGGEPWSLKADTRGLLIKYGIVNEGGALTVWGKQLMVEFKNWLTRQRHHLDTLVGDAETREGEYYTPMELTLAKSPIDSVALLTGDAAGNNGAYRVVMNRDTDPVNAIFKPRDLEGDERPGAVEQGTLYRRERAAYEIDHELGLDLTPPCVIRKLDVGAKFPLVGSLAHWESGEAAWCAKGDWRAECREDDLKTLAAFDYMLLTDRHTGNFLLQKDSKRTDGTYRLWAVDHGYSLPMDVNLGMAMYQSAPHQWVYQTLGGKLPHALMTKLRGANKDRLRDRLQRLGIEDSAITGFLGRLNELIAHGLPAYRGVDLA